MLTCSSWTSFESESICQQIQFAGAVGWVAGVCLDVTTAMHDVTASMSEARCLKKVLHSVGGEDPQHGGMVRGLPGRLSLGRKLLEGQGQHGRPGFRGEKSCGQEQVVSCGASA